MNTDEIPVWSGRAVPGQERGGPDRPDSTSVDRDEPADAPYPTAPAPIQALAERYQRLPSWVLLPQMFLAAGWGRAAVAHALSEQWWNGQEVLQFLATETDRRVWLYDPILTEVIRPLPSVTATVVVAVQIVVALMLALNYRALTALAIGAFLNLQFVLAGAVNPSIFYLVAALGIVIWRLETAGNRTTVRRLATVAPFTAIGAAVLLAPSVETLGPEAAIEDPALVLIFLAVLAAAALWWVDHRTTLAARALAELTDDDRDNRAGTPSLWSAASVVAAVGILIAGLSLLGDRADGGSSEPVATDEAAVGAGAGAAATAVVGRETRPVDGEGPGSSGQPYPFGHSVTLAYDDLAADTDRTWLLQVLEPLRDGTDDLAPGTTDGLRLASARIRVSNDGGGTAAPLDQLLFNTVGATGTVFPMAAECGDGTGRLPIDDRLDPSATVEGRLCWWVPVEEVDSLILGVEAVPADGVVYLDLR